MKIKYWTACVSFSQNKTIVTHVGNPFTNLREAKKAKRYLNSSNAAVVRADENECSTNEVVA